MFINQPCTYMPRLRFVTAPDPTGGGDQSTPTDDDLGFPKDTPVDDMTPEQKVAYWKNQSKTQQRAREDAERAVKAYEKFGTVDELQSAADAAEQARVAALSESERAAEAARVAAEAADEARQGSRQLLSAAVTGMLIAHTKGAQESFEDAQARVAGAIEFADLTKFVGEDGALDAAKVQTYAQSLGSKDSGGNAPGGFDLLNAMQRQSTPQQGGAGSVSALEQVAYDRMTNKQ